MKFGEKIKNGLFTALFAVAAYTSGNAVYKALYCPNFSTNSPSRVCQYFKDKKEFTSCENTYNLKVDGKDVKVWYREGSFSPILMIQTGSTIIESSESVISPWTDITVKKAGMYQGTGGEIRDSEVRRYAGDLADRVAREIIARESDLEGVRKIQREEAEKARARDALSDLRPN